MCVCVCARTRLRVVKRKVLLMLLKMSIPIKMLVHYVQDHAVCPRLSLCKGDHFNAGLLQSTRSAAPVQFAQKTTFSFLFFSRVQSGHGFCQDYPVALQTGRRCFSLLISLFSLSASKFLPPPHISQNIYLPSDFSVAV